GRGNLEGVEGGGAAETEVDWRVVLREVAAAAMNLVGLRHAAGGELDARADREAIALGARQFEADPMAAGHAGITQNHRAALQILDDDVHIAVVEEVADGEAA